MSTNDRVRDLLRTGWRAEDWRPEMRNEEDSIVLVINDHGPKVWAFTLPTGEWCVVHDDGKLRDRWRGCWPNLHDPATFALALAVLARRVGLPDTSPVPYAWWWTTPAGAWVVESPDGCHSHTFAPFPEPTTDPVLALAAALAATVEKP